MKKINENYIYPLSSSSYSKNISNIFKIISIVVDEKYNMLFYDNHYIPLIPYKMYFGKIKLKVDSSSNLILNIGDYYKFKKYDFLNFLKEIELNKTHTNIYDEIEDEVIKHFHTELEYSMVNRLFYKIDFSKEHKRYNKILKVFNKYFLKNKIFTHKNNTILTYYTYKYYFWGNLKTLHFINKRNNK